MRFTAFIILLALSTIQSFGQTEPLISTYTMTRGWINPAQITSNPADLQVKLLHRSQWTAMDNSPSTQLFSVENKFRGNKGIGFYLSNDQLGFEKITSVSLHYSQSINFGGFMISLGLGAGVANRKLDGSKLRYQNPDPNAIESDQNESTPDFNFGFAVHLGKLTVSTSLKHLLYSRNNDDFFKISRQFFAEGYYQLALSQHIITEPSISYKETGFTRKVGFGSTTTFYDKISAGINYHSGKEANFIFGMNISQTIQINYSFQHIFSDDVYVRPDSHEVSLVLSFNKHHTKLFQTPRYL
jgi:type IX secretion system PorP/SprF family membrane protein